jgi:hypothetical protein
MFFNVQNMLVMMARIRLTQKDLLFGIYRGAPQSPNPGLNIWWRDHYIWPRKRLCAVVAPQELKLPFQTTTNDAETKT